MKPFKPLEPIAATCPACHHTFAAARTFRTASVPVPFGSKAPSVTMYGHVDVEELCEICRLLSLALATMEDAHALVARASEMAVARKAAAASTP